MLDIARKVGPHHCLNSWGAECQVMDAKAISQPVWQGYAFHPHPEAKTRPSSQRPRRFRSAVRTLSRARAKTAVWGRNHRLKKLRTR